MIIQFLDSLPETFASTRDIQCATGAAMQAALKLLVRYLLSHAHFTVHDCCMTLTSLLPVLCIQMSVAK